MYQCGFRLELSSSVWTAGKSKLNGILMPELETLYRKLMNWNQDKQKMLKLITQKFATS
jgi:hypothetical protein